MSYSSWFATSTSCRDLLPRMRFIKASRLDTGFIARTRCSSASIFLKASSLTASMAWSENVTLTLRTWTRLIVGLSTWLLAPTYMLACFFIEVLPSLIPYGVALSAEAPFIIIDPADFLLSPLFAIFSELFSIIKAEFSSIIPPGFNGGRIVESLLESSGGKLKSSRTTSFFKLSLEDSSTGLSYEDSLCLTLEEFVFAAIVLPPGMTMVWIIPFWPMKLELLAIWFREVLPGSYGIY